MKWYLARTHLGAAPKAEQPGKSRCRHGAAQVVELESLE